MSRKWTTDIKIPQDSSYIIRIIEESFNPSKSSGNPMITLKAEIVSPEEVEVGEEQINIAGVQPSPMYYTTQVMDGEGVVNQEKTDNCAKRLKTLYTAFEMDATNINPENPTLGFKGKVVYALLYPDTTERRKSPTAAQLKAGQKQGDIMLNPKTKQPLVQHYIKVAEIFGLAPTDAAKPY
jgi:hypothetical protein